MTKSELMELWKGMPGDAEIVIEADHGQTPEYANGINIIQDDLDDVNLEEAGWRNVTPSTKRDRVTAILIC